MTQKLVRIEVDIERIVDGLADYIAEKTDRLYWFGTFIEKSGQEHQDYELRILLKELKNDPKTGS